jgi:hypothetical protein
VIREGERVRITTQLIDGRTDHHLWSERYDRDLRGILELQSDVPRKIELELTPGATAKLADRARSRLRAGARAAGKRLVSVVRLGQCAVELEWSAASGSRRARRPYSS